MADAIKLAMRLYTISKGKKTLALEVGQDAENNIVLSKTITKLSFNYIELYDGSEERLRLSLRARPGRFFYPKGGAPELRIGLPFPLAHYADGADGLDRSSEVFATFQMNMLAVKMFAKDGSLKLNLKSGPAHAHGAPGPSKSVPGVTLHALSNPSDLYEFERRLFATSAPVTIKGRDFPLLTRLLRSPVGVVVSDIDGIAKDPVHFPNFPDPRSMMVRPVGIRRAKPKTEACDFLAFGARIRVGREKADVPGTATLVLDEADNWLDIPIRVDEDIYLDLVPDVFQQPDITKGETTAVAAYFSYLRIRPLPPQLFVKLWNEAIAPPYLAALRTIDDAADLSFVPVLKNITPVSAGSAAFEALYDIVQPDVSKGDQIAEIAIAAIRPVRQSATFFADAVFPGLITHKGEKVVRRVKVTVEKQSIEDTYEWFDAWPIGSAKPEINVTIEARANGASGVGGLVRIGAFDLDVPSAATATTGGLRLHYAITFDSLDPSRARYAAAGDVKGRDGRARLPRAGEAVPRIRTQIERFDLHDVRPGAQDPVPDSGRAFDAVVEDFAWRDVEGSDPDHSRVVREKRIARNLSRATSVVVVDGAGKKTPQATPFFLRGREMTASKKNRQFTLTLHRVPEPQSGQDQQPDPALETARRKRAIVVDCEPFAVAMVDVPPLGADSAAAQANDGEFANWELSEAGGAKWEIAGITEGFDLYFPPQATGEALEKGSPWTPISATGAETTIDYRLGTVARLELQSSYYRQRYAEAPWNLRRVLGFAGDRAPGAALKTARFEYLYGLGGRLSAPGLRLAEQGARIGGIRDPLPARPYGLTRALPEDESSRQPLVEAELYDRFRDVSASFAKVYGTRLAHFEPYREGSDDPLSVEEKVAFELRLGLEAGMDTEPWMPTDPPMGFGGGATRGFESSAIYEEVVSKPTSTRGQIITPGFSALGGSGFVRAFFANGKTRIVSDTSIGRTHTYAIERIGRIGVFWNIAKHVIVYERTVLPHDQFHDQQAGQHFGRQAEMLAARQSLFDKAKALGKQFREAADRGDVRSLIVGYETYHAAALATIDAAGTTARRRLPRSIKSAPLFSGKTRTLDTYPTGLHRKVTSEHDRVVAAIQTEMMDAQHALKEIGNAIAATITAVEDATNDLQDLVDLGHQTGENADKALGQLTNGLDAVVATSIDLIREECLKTGHTIATLKAAVLSQLNCLQKNADGFRGKAHDAARDLRAILGGVLDEVGNNVADVEKALGDQINQANVAATTTITDLENELVVAIDDGIATLKGYSGDLAAAIQDAAEKLKTGADAIASGLRQQIPPAVADNIRVLEEGYKRLSKAPTFQNPSDTLALVRAAGASPILPNLTFNRERIAYFFDDARDAIRTSPVVALMNRLDDDLKALGIRIPTDEILERLIPKGMENFDFGKLFPDLGGLKLDGLFKNLRMPAALNDRVKVTQGFDKASLSAWAKAEASSAFPDRSEIFEYGPLKLSMVGGRFDASANLAVDPDGVTRRTARGEIVGDWELAFSGRPLVTLEQTRVFFEDGNGLDVDINPARVRLDRSIRFLSDLIKSYGAPDSGFFLEMLEEQGMPAGIAARIDLPLPPLSFGAFSATGLRFSSTFALQTSSDSGAKRGDFALSTALAIGRKSEPFVLRVWIFVGAGWLETRAKYFPTSGKLSSAVSIGLTAGLGLDFAFGPCRGFVYAMFGAYAEFENDGGGGKSFSIAVIFVVRGGIVILGRFNIGLSLLLELVYRDDGTAVGRGTIEVSFRVCWCCEIKVRQGVTYQLSKTSGKAKTAAMPHYLDSFA
ncbi:hypothetical protein J2Y48_002175 [Mycoplana sp. BE70]|uniref:hypothetical protein n=1 Tax=Mycoplana sp. BE70 TaxID=2817775 RepID=UPI00285834B1|nr:hypothetical protein [Mycoplana sp. BE70]MDR6756879.1 hypothetical protein [Mycoplana sp. BE70]